MTDIWFRPKTYGYGATPVNWKGWAAIGGYIGSMTGGSLLLLSPEVAGPPGSARILLWAALAGITTAAFFRVCKAHTDGEWKWRWPGKQ